MNLYTVYDKASKIYGNPWPAHNDVTATRQFKQEVNRQAETNPIYTNPSDFALFQIGEYDNESGRITPVMQKIIVEASTLVNKPEETK